MIDEDKCEEIGGTMEGVILSTNETACVLEPEHDVVVALYEGYSGQEKVSIGRKSNNPNYDEIVIREVAHFDTDFDQGTSNPYEIRFEDVDLASIHK